MLVVVVEMFVVQVVVATVVVSVCPCRTITALFLLHTFLWSYKAKL